MIDFSEVEAYYGPRSVEDLDAAVAAALNPDSAPDATHENNLISSAAVANALSQIVRTFNTSETQNFTLAANERMLIIVQQAQSGAGVYSVFCSTDGTRVFFDTIYEVVNASTYWSVSKSGATFTVTRNSGVLSINVLRFGVAD